MLTLHAAGSRPIVLTEIDQFGGAERSVVALSRWLHQQTVPTMSSPTSTARTSLNTLLIPCRSLS